MRIITDDQQMASQGSDVQRLADGGVPVRHDADGARRACGWAGRGGSLLALGAALYYNLFSFETSKT